MKDLFDKVSDSDLDILKVLWKNKKEMNLTEIRKELSKVNAWKPSTVKTLLSRLTEKEVLRIVKREVFYYEPLISEEEYNDLSTQKIIDKLFNGNVKNLLASLVNKNKLTKKDFEELRNSFKVGEVDE